MSKSEFNRWAKTPGTKARVRAPAIKDVKSNTTDNRDTLGTNTTDVESYITSSRARSVVMWWEKQSGRLQPEVAWKIAALGLDTQALLDALSDILQRARGVHGVDWLPRSLSYFWPGLQVKENELLHKQETKRPDSDFKRMKPNV